MRDEKEYFDGIQDVKVTKDTLDLAKHIVNQRASTFEPEKFEDRYETALTELINAKRQGKTIATKPRPRGENVVDLIDALKKSLASETAPKCKKSQGGRRPKGNAAADRRQAQRGEESRQARAINGTHEGWIGHQQQLAIDFPSSVRGSEKIPQPARTRKQLGGP